MSDRRLTATARVRLTLDIPVGDSWGADCNIAQIEKQAAESAIGLIRNAGDFGRLYSAGRIEIIGEPQVTAVLVRSDR